ncbi:EF-hand domain-containing protein [Thalassovita aquimarina]|nr:EF-hand domain-containing protein [Thalassovita aquimarina]
MSASHGHPVMRAAQYQGADSGGKAAAASLGEQVATRFDQNEDGGVSADELQGTRLGRKMSVDAFSKIDGDGDGKLTAEEFDSAVEQAGLPGRRVGWTRHPHGLHPGGTNAVLNRIEATQGGTAETPAEDTATPVDGSDGAAGAASTEAIGTDAAEPSEIVAETALEEGTESLAEANAADAADAAAAVDEAVSGALMDQAATADVIETVTAPEEPDASTEVIEDLGSTDQSAAVETASASEMTNTLALNAYAKTNELIAEAA